MMTDPLAQYRKSPLPAPSAQPTAPKAKDAAPLLDEYVAFATKDKATRLRVRSANAPTRAASYDYLVEVVYDGPYGTNFVLSFGFLTVLVLGRNLQQMIFAIETGAADFIQEFDPDRFKAPTDESAAFIESIQCVDPKGKEIPSGLPLSGPGGIKH